MSTMTQPRTDTAHVRLGVRFAEAYPNQCEVIAFSVTLPPDGCTLDDVFTALNRIRDCQQADVDALQWEWQRIARRRLDLLRAPSMSVGDTIELFSLSGRRLGKFAVAPSGWTAVDA